VIPLMAAVGTAFASWMLLRLDWNPVRISTAVWIPLAWLTIASSRPVSNWITLGSPATVSSQYIDGSPLDRNVLTFLLILAVVALSRRSRQVKAILLANPALVIFLAYCGISMLWADYPLVLLKRWIRAVGDVAMVCVIVTEAYPEVALKRVLTWVGAFLLPLSILFTRFFPSLGRAYTYSGVPMWTGVACDKNALGALCMIAGVLLLSRGLTTYSSSDRRYRGRRLLVIGLLFAMAVYLLTMIDSKTALACFVMASSLILMRIFPSAFRKPWLLTTMVASMIALTYSILFLGVGSHAISEMGRDTSLTGRTQVWEIVIPFAVNPWIGAGYENFWIGERLNAIVRAIGTNINQAHNGYIEIYLNIGWVGLLLLGAVVIYGYRNIMRGLREDPEMSGLKLAFFFICLVYNFTEAAFKIMSPVWITFLWATMAVPKASVPVASEAPQARQVSALSDWTSVLSELDTPNRAESSG
jgi:exopolysaccharide production protein ExoQ